jgi:crossover junction endodeoxyribonuclease RusA
MSRWPAGEPPATGAIQLGITHVYASVAIDLDNLAKPVLDALKGLVFQDDEQITDMTMRKRQLDRILQIETPLPLLLDALDRGEEFLHVLVQEVSNLEVLV